MISACRVLDLVAGQHAGYQCRAATECDDNTRGIDGAIRILDYRSGRIADDDVGDRHQTVIGVTIDEVDPGFHGGALRCDLDLRALAALQLHYIKRCLPRVEHAGEVDIGFDIGFVLIQIWNRNVRLGTRHKREPDAFLLDDHLIIRAEGRGSARLAGIDRVARRDVYPGRLVRRVLARGNDGRPLNPAVRIHRRGCRGKYQEQILTRRGVGKTERQVFTGSDVHFIQQSERIVSVCRIGMFKRLVLR